MAIDYPPDDFTLRVRRWLAEDVYPQSLGETFDDRAATVWLDGSGGFVGLWVSGYAAGHDPESRLTLCQHEVFRRIYRAKFPPPTPTHPDPLSGALRLVQGRRAFGDDTGPRLPVVCHVGDLIGQGLVKGAAHVTRALDQIAGAGYHVVRSWVNVQPVLGTKSDRFWRDKPAPRWTILDDLDRAADILAAGAARGLRWHLDPGGLDGLSNAEEDRLFDAIGDLMARVGPEYVALVAACNEVRDTGDADDHDPDELARLIDRVRRRFPTTLYALTSYTGTEDREIVRRYTPDWMDFTYIHAERGGRAHDKLRHAFSWVYEAPIRRLVWQGEPWGVGRAEGPYGLLVSAQANGHELLDPTVLQLGAAVMAMRGVACFMSDPGVILYDEDFPTVPGFAEVPALVRRLPQDLATWPVLSHSGDTKRGLRIHAYRGDVRADYAIAADGRYVEITYGPPEQIDHGPLVQERATRDVVRLVEGRWGWAEMGRLA